MATFSLTYRLRGRKITNDVRTAGPWQFTETAHLLFLLQIGSRITEESPLARSLITEIFDAWAIFQCQV